MVPHPVSPVSPSAARHFVANEVDLVAATVVLVLWLFGPATGWLGSARGPMAVGLFVAYLTVVGRSGRLLGGLVTNTIVVGPSGIRLGWGWAALRAVVETAVSFVLMPVGAGAALLLASWSGLATGHAVWPFVVATVAALVLPAAIDALTSLLPGRRGLWDRCVRADLRAAAPGRRTAVSS